MRHRNKVKILIIVFAVAILIVADVVIYLLGLSEILNINLESEILKKIEKNESRVYYTIDGVLKKKDF